MSKFFKCIGTEISYQCSFYLTCSSPNTHITALLRTMLILHCLIYICDICKCVSFLLLDIGYLLCLSFLITLDRDIVICLKSTSNFWLCWTSLLCNCFLFLKCLLLSSLLLSCWYSSNFFRWVFTYLGFRPSEGNSLWDCVLLFLYCIHKLWHEIFCYSSQHIF